MEAAGIGFDARSLDSLRRQAQDDPRAASREAARQFEALFMRELLSTMRASIPKSGLMNSAGEKMAQEMLDEQLAQNMAGRPGGLGEVLARQLSKYLPDGKTPDLVLPAAGATEAQAPRIGALMRRLTRQTNNPAGTVAAGSAATDPSMPVGETGNQAAGEPVVRFGGLPTELLNALASARPAESSSRQERFVQRLWSHARAAEQATGVPAAFVLGQAALESGWGRGEMRHADGRPAYNLFGIKAGSSWTGPTVEVATTEYLNGQPTRLVERFRAYESYEESFNDWISLMTDQPRYQQVLRQATTPAAFARGLQEAGYATDPNYASKLNQVIERTIALQQDLA